MRRQSHEAVRLTESECVCQKRNSQNGHHICWMNLHKARKLWGSSRVWMCLDHRLGAGLDKQLENISVRWTIHSELPIPNKASHHREDLVLAETRTQAHQRTKTKVGHQNL